MSVDRFDLARWKRENPKQLILAVECPYTGQDHEVYAITTVIGNNPQWCLSWLCPDCNDSHREFLGVGMFEALIEMGYDIYGALGGMLWVNTS